MACTTGSAPGRLDFLGGVADYSGALVLEVPTRQSIGVVAETDEALVVGPAVLSVTEMTHLAELEYVDVRRALEGLPRWTHYLIGIAIVLVRHGTIAPPRARLRISSDLPHSMGVASSAALEVATARALGAGAIDPLRLARLCHEAENFVVGAPCGVMDQVAVAVGSPGAVLPILCRPASPWPAVTLPPDLEIVGWPSGAAHDVGGTPYRRARSAAFMGRRHHCRYLPAGCVGPHGRAHPLRPRAGFSSAPGSPTGRGGALPHDQLGGHHNVALGDVVVHEREHEFH